VPREKVQRQKSLLDIVASNQAKDLGWGAHWLSNQGVVNLCKNVHKTELRCRPTGQFPKTRRDFSISFSLIKFGFFTSEEGTNMSFIPSDPIFLLKIKSCRVNKT